MQHLCAHVNPSASGIHGVVIELNLALVIAFDKARALSVADVYRRYDDHGESGAN